MSSKKLNEIKLEKRKHENITKIATEKFALFKKDIPVNDRFDLVLKRTKTNEDQVLVGYSLKKGFFRSTAEPVKVDKKELEKGLYIAGHIGSGIDKVRLAFLYDQLKDGKGGMYLSGDGFYGHVMDFYSLASALGRKDDLLFIDGSDEVSNAIAWDFFKDGETEEIINFISDYCKENYPEYVQQKLKNTLFYLVHYLKERDEELTSDNAASLIDLIRYDLNFTFNLNEQIKNNKSAEDFKDYLSMTYKDSSIKEKQKELKLIESIIKESIHEVNRVFSSFVVNKETMNFKDAVKNKKIIYFHADLERQNEGVSRALMNFILNRYNAALLEYKRQVRLEDTYRPFVFMSRVSSFVSDEAILSYRQQVNHGNIYLIYSSREIDKDYKNNNIYEFISRLPHHIVMRTEELNDEISEKIKENIGEKLEPEEMSNLRPSEAYYGYYGHCEFISLPFVDIEHLKTIELK